MFSSTTSTKFVSNVRKLVGFDKMQELSARYIDRAIKTSVNVDAANKSLFNPDAFAKKLGLDDINSKKFLVTQEMLRGSPVTIKMLTDFVQVAKIAAASEIPEVSKFLARRVVLAGTYAGISALALQQFGTEGGILTPIVLALMARKGSRIISNPENVRLASMALDFNANQVVRRAALIRLVGLVYRDEEGEQQLELNNPMLRMLTPDLAPDTSFGMDPMEQLRNRFSEPEG